MGRRKAKELGGRLVDTVTWHVPWKKPVRGERGGKVFLFIRRSAPLHLLITPRWALLRYEIWFTRNFQKLRKSTWSFSLRSLPVEDGLVAPALVCPDFQWTFSHFPLGKWGWRWGWPRWRWRFSKWRQYFWAAGRATGRVRNVRKKVMFLFSYPKWDIRITACRQTKEETGAPVLFIFWWWEQASFTKGDPFLQCTLLLGLLSRCNC